MIQKAGLAHFIDPYGTVSTPNSQEIVMRLLILNPNTSEDFTRAIQAAGEAVKSPMTEVVCLTLPAGRDP